MKTTGVWPEALATSISRLSRSLIDAGSNRPGDGASRHGNRLPEEFRTIHCASAYPARRDPSPPGRAGESPMPDPFVA